MSLPSNRYIVWHCEPNWSETNHLKWWPKYNKYRGTYVIIDLLTQTVVYRPIYTTDVSSICYRRAEELNKTLL